MTPEWHHIPEITGAGVQEQWQARVAGRSVAVIRRSTCEWPRCDCVRQGCERAVPGWTGLMLDPNNVVLDIQITGSAATIENARLQVEQGLANIGWRA